MIVPGSPGDDDLGLPYLMAVLDLEPLDTQLFRSQPAGEPGHRLFGGQVAAQALVAAERTTAQAARAHSLHAYFLRPGETGQPVVFQVDPLQDGRTFSRRRVTAIQGGRPILCLETSFTTDQATHRLPGQPACGAGPGRLPADGAAVPRHRAPAGPCVRPAGGHRAGRPGRRTSPTTCGSGPGGSGMAHRSGTAR